MHEIAPHNRVVQLSQVLKLRNSVLTEEEIMKEWILVTELAIKIETNL